uniref:Uncharacterized protein n=1 Tax=Vitis vinifera TaxID=29760 RepID=A5AQ41_VITVI|nr:hypothetical protein VITISV_026245 [Vitis vinifera]
MVYRKLKSDPGVRLLIGNVRHVGCVVAIWVAYRRYGLPIEDMDCKREVWAAHERLWSATLTKLCVGESWWPWELKNGHIVAMGEPWAAWELKDGHTVAMDEPWAAWELGNGHMMALGESWAAWELKDGHMVAMGEPWAAWGLCGGHG